MNVFNGFFPNTSRRPKNFAEAVYFSVVTFTTLGYGDVTVGYAWRLLASLEAADGTITFGWTTALIVAIARQMSARDPET